MRQGWAGPRTAHPPGGRSLAITALFPELPAHEYAHAADAVVCGLGQALPGRLLADLAALQDELLRCVLVAVATPRGLPTAFAAEKGRVGNQLYLLLLQLALILRIPAVTADENAQASGRVCSTCSGKCRP